jgi:hypothetical protein
LANSNSSLDRTLTPKSCHTLTVQLSQNALPSGAIVLIGHRATDKTAMAEGRT